MIAFRLIALPVAIVATLGALVTVAAPGVARGTAELTTTRSGTEASNAPGNPRCISRGEYRKLQTSAEPWNFGTKLRRARKIIGSLGTTQLAPNHPPEQGIDGYDENVGLDYRTAAYAFGVRKEYIFGAGGRTRPCKPWNKKSFVVLIFRQYHWKGGHGPWRLVGPEAPVPSTEAAGFRGHTSSRWKHN